MADAPALSGDAAAALQRFLGHLSSRNSSPGTIREYRRHVAQFFGFLGSRGIDWRSPDRATVRAYLGTLAERGLSGCVLFDTHHIAYYTGFAFIPTERPVAFALATDGRGGMLVPRLEVDGGAHGRLRARSACVGGSRDGSVAFASVTTASPVRTVRDPLEESLPARPGELAHVPLGESLRLGTPDPQDLGRQAREVSRFVVVAARIHLRTSLPGGPLGT